MPYEEDSNSFLFGLNQFTSPSADQQHGNNASTNMLAGLEAFSSDDLGAPAHGDEPGQAPNFADQLALWTNANFSFDGPTGHALIGDEEKEKEEAENNRRREEENRRNEAEDRERMARNAAASSRGGNAARGKARETQSHNEASHDHQTNHHLQNHAQGGQAPHQQQSQPQHSQPQPQLPVFPGPLQVKSPLGFASGFSGSNGSNQDGRPLQLPNGHLPSGSPAQPNGANANGFPPFFNGFPGFSQFGGIPPSHSPPAANPMGGVSSFDMTSALALQHLLASNPLALASLSQFAGFTNPQLQAHLASFAASYGLGGVNGPFGQQGVAQGGVSQAPSPWDDQQQQNARHDSASGASSAAGPPAGWPSQISSLPSAGGAAASPSVNPSSAASTGARGSNGPSASSTPFAGSRNASVPPPPANGASDDPDSDTIPSKKKRFSISNSKKASAGSDDNSDDGLRNDDASDRKYEIPPLKLIDTGNPEADAEANRLAIEEDKRRRNTAASARFRIKKKQREAALEHTAKELQQRVAELESENGRLRTENGWLKSLITVQPGQRAGVLDGAAASFSAAAGPSRAPLDALPSQTALPSARGNDSEGLPRANGSITSDRTSQDHLERNSGLVPRGVGTGSGQQKETNTNGAPLKRDREN